VNIEKMKNEMTVICYLG